MFESDSDVSRDQEGQKKKKKKEELKNTVKAKLEGIKQEPIPVEDEFNPEGFNPYPKECEEEKDHAIGKDYEMKFDFKDPRK